jgi:hypothetical protein
LAYTLGGPPNESGKEYSHHVSELEVPQHFGGSRDRPREERKVQQLHDAVQDSAAGADAEPGRRCEALRTELSQ